MNLRELGFISSKADPDLWMKAAVKPNGDKVYEYVISYVDDLIFQGIDPKGFMNALGQRFTLKPGSIKEPDSYLGVDVKKFRIPDSDDPDKVRWAFESTSYVKKAISDVDKELAEADLRLLPNAKTPLASGHRPELDLSPELGSKQLNYYQQGLIGVLRWICEIGRIDILMPVSLMSRYLVSARQGHLEQVFHIFAYLKHHPRSTMVFDDTIPTFRGESDLIRRHKTHEKFQTDAKTLSEAAKPDKFKDSVKWEDWKPTFLNNYLRSIPGRDGIPLKYICREKDEPDPMANDDFLDDYVAMAPLEGDSYAIDTVQVHTFLLNFVSGNDTAEAKLQGLTRPNDGRDAFKRLVEHYEGVGIHAIDICEADEVIKNLFYAGEKPPHMWWSEFEKRLTRAFNAYVKREGRIVHSDSMKIRMLIDKIKADFLTPTKAQLEIELSRTPMTVTYEQALALFRNMVNQKHPPQMNANNCSRRNINEVTTGGRGKASGRGGHGRGGRGGKHGGRGNRGKTRTDSRMITLTDGSQIEYHASFNFPKNVYLKMKKQEDRDTLKRERAAYNERNGRTSNRTSEIQELRSQIEELRGSVSANECQLPSSGLYLSFLPFPSEPNDDKQFNNGRTQRTSQ